MNWFTTLLAVMSLSMSGIVQEQEIVHDAEQYILDAQNGKRWAAEDKALR